MDPSLGRPDSPERSKRRDPLGRPGPDSRLRRWEGGWIEALSRPLPARFARASPSWGGYPGPVEPPLPRLPNQRATPLTATRASARPMITHSSKDKELTELKEGQGRTSMGSCAEWVPVFPLESVT